MNINKKSGRFLASLLIASSSFSVNALGENAQNSSIPSSNTEYTTAEAVQQISTEAPVSSRYSVRDYFNLKENLDYVFSSPEGVTSSKCEFLSGDTAQYGEMTAGRKYVRYITVTDAYAEITERISYTGIRENTSALRPQGEVVLIYPMEEGITWESNGHEFTILRIKETDTQGNITVVRRSTSGEEAFYTFSLGKGLTNFRDNSGNYMNLEEVRNGEPEKVDITFWYPENNSKKMTLQFFTNDSMREILTEKYSEVPEGFIPVLGDGSRIQYIYLENGIVRIDLNQEFETYAGKDPEKEDGIIKSLAKTVCSVYGAEGMSLTINDGRYESPRKKIETYEIIIPG